jgi:flagellar biosynthesis protein FlhB
MKWDIFNKENFIINFIIKNWKNLSIDLFIILIGIPGLLYLLFLLPANVKEMLILHRDYFNGLDIFANNFIHEKLEHLVKNVLIYTSFISILYFSLLNNRKLFYKLLKINLLVIPFFCFINLDIYK